MRQRSRVTHDADSAFRVLLNGIDQVTFMIRAPHIYRYVIQFEMPSNTRNDLIKGK